MPERQPAADELTESQRAEGAPRASAPDEPGVARSDAPNGRPAPEPAGTAAADTVQHRDADAAGSDDPAPGTAGPRPATTEVSPAAAAPSRDAGAATTGSDAVGAGAPARPSGPTANGSDAGAADRGVVPVEGAGEGPVEAGAGAAPDASAQMDAPAQPAPDPAEADRPASDGGVPVADAAPAADSPAAHSGQASGPKAARPAVAESAAESATRPVREQAAARAESPAWQSTERPATGQPDAGPAGPAGAPENRRPAPGQPVSALPAAQRPLPPRNQPGGGAQQPPVDDAARPTATSAGSGAGRHERGSDGAAPHAERTQVVGAAGLAAGSPADSPGRHERAPEAGASSEQAAADGGARSADTSAGGSAAADERVQPAAEESAAVADSGPGRHEAAQPDAPARPAGSRPTGGAAHQEPPPAGGADQAPAAGGTPDPQQVPAAGGAAHPEPAPAAGGASRAEQVPAAGGASRAEQVPAAGGAAHKQPEPGTAHPQEPDPASARQPDAAATTQLSGAALFAAPAPGAAAPTPTGTGADQGSAETTQVLSVVTPRTATPQTPAQRRPVEEQRLADAETTQVLPQVGPPAGGATVRLAREPESPTELMPVTPRPAATGDGPPPAAATGPGGPGGPDDPGAAGAPRRRRRRGLLVGAAVVGLLVVLYLVDLLVGMGNVPRGVKVAGEDVGGLSRAAAEEHLRAVIDPRVAQPIVVTAGEVRTQIEPKVAGLRVDWDATLDRASDQPLNPITRVLSFFTTTDYDVVNTADQRAVGAALEQLAPLVDKQPVEGSVRFDGLNPVAVPPVDGHRLDVPVAVEAVARDWATGRPVALPLAVLPPVTTLADVQQAVDDVARPAVSAPITVKGEGADAVMQPADIAEALTFRADPMASPKLVPELTEDAVSDSLKPQLAATEKPGRDATLDFATGTPVIVPSQDGRGIDYAKTINTLVPVLTAPAPRQISAVYADQPAKVTTEDINKMGITGEISSFTTGGFAADSGRNIKRAAEQINGSIVKPGETFSLNGKTNPRNAANGYVEAGIIEDGHPARGVGGGVSQVATTLYNAAYFAGMVDVAHKEHSFYISRYPVAREATVFDNVIDLKFRNDGPTAVMIRTIWTPSSLTVKFYGTKRYEVTSTTGPRTNETAPTPVTIPAGQPCSPSQGAPGFTATDTRTLRNVQTGEVKTEKRTVRYNPSPIVVCGS